MSQNKKSAKAPSAYSNHFEAMKTLAKCRLIPGTCKLVLQNILAHASSKGGIAYPSQATIAKDIGLTRRQVMRAIKGLVQVRAIEIMYQTKQAARNAGISIKGNPILDKDGEPVQENLNTMHVLWGWAGYNEKTISKADHAILKTSLKAKHAASARPAETASTGCQAAVYGVARDTMVVSPAGPGMVSPAAPGWCRPCHTNTLTDIEHLTVPLEQRSLKTSLSLEHAANAEKENPAEPATNTHPNVFTSTPNILKHAEKEKPKDFEIQDQTTQDVIQHRDTSLGHTEREKSLDEAVQDQVPSNVTGGPLSCTEFYRAFKEYNPKWLWTRSCVTTFMSHWKNNPDFRALSREIMTKIQTNTELARLCSNLDPNYLFRKDYQGGMVWQKLLTGVAYFNSTKKKPPVTITLHNDDNCSMTVTEDTYQIILNNKDHLFHDAAIAYQERSGRARSPGPSGPTKVETPGTPGLDPPTSSLTTILGAELDRRAMQGDADALDILLNQ